MQATLITHNSSFFWGSRRPIKNIASVRSAAAELLRGPLFTFGLSNFPSSPRALWGSRCPSRSPSASEYPFSIPKCSSVSISLLVSSKTTFTCQFTSACRSITKRSSLIIITISFINIFVSLIIKSVSLTPFAHQLHLQSVHFKYIACHLYFQSGKKQHHLPYISRQIHHSS